MTTSFTHAKLVDWKPSKKDIRFYSEHGWFVTPTIIPGDLLDLAETGIDAYYKGCRDRQLPDWASKFDWTPDQGNVLRLNNYISLQIDSVRKLIMYPLLGRTAAFLTKTPAIRLYKDSVIFKPPFTKTGNTKVGWHTDRSYWMMCTSENMLTAWIPFQNSAAFNGSLAVIDGSHKWPIHHELRTFNNQDTKEFEEMYTKIYGKLPKKALTVNRGQISFHDCRLLHGSMENNSTKERLTLAVHLQPDENRYRVFSDGDGKPLSHLNDFLCKKNPEGNPDYCDQEIFPELWNSVSIKKFQD